MEIEGHGNGPRALAILVECPIGRSFLLGLGKGSAEGGNLAGLTVAAAAAESVKSEKLLYFRQFSFVFQLQCLILKLKLLGIELQYRTRLFRKMSGILM